MTLSLNQITFRNFRNYENFQLSDIGPLTIITGPNAVGKTNIIEGIQLISSLQSFRRPTFEQLLYYGENSMRIKAEITDENRFLTVAFQIQDEKKNYSLNGKNKRIADLKGLLPAVTFTPDDLELVKGASSVKRAALDNLGSQLSLNHYVIKKDYEKVIRYKNKLLKEEASFDLIASIDETLITCGAQLACYRAALCEKISVIIKRYYEKITDGREQIELCYIPSWEFYDQNNPVSFSFSREQARQSLHCALERVYPEERVRHRSLMGPHIDHIEFFIDNKNAALYGSQGQQRSIVLAFKLAEVTLIQEILGQKPLLLLDDVMSELDESRRRALVSFIEGDIQTFISTTNLSYFEDSLLKRAHILKLSPQ